MANNSNKNKCNVPHLRFPEFTGEWKNTSLGEIGKTFNGLTGKSSADFGQGFPYITYKSIFDDSKIDISRVEYVEITDVERKKKTQNEVQYGDVFFTTSSETPDEVGMSSVLLDKIKDCYLNSFCFGYRLNSLSETIPEYMRFYLRSQTIRKKMFVLAQGSTRFNISKSEVMGMSINIPEIEEQRKIANLLTLLDDRIATQNKIIEKLESLIKGIAHKVAGMGKPNIRISECL
ncbi:restriction endonuclease subunit S, partial [Bacteroides acidifaciens]|uniref:restriction endonuclease subunit S n=1 Tax=Bacteroides acidifaciens TaxID=85831 RepID=UPI00267622FF